MDTERAQFTPDLMPGDVTGSLVYDAPTAQFSFRAGPIFANLLLADEINRTPRKRHRALLEAMEERQVSVDGKAMPLPEPFMVIATDDPVEYEGTYPLPEAQLDGFLLKIAIDLPPRDVKVEVLTRHAARIFSPRATSRPPNSRPCATIKDIDAARAQVQKVDHVGGRHRPHRRRVPRATREAPSTSLGVSRRAAPPR